MHKSEKDQVDQVVAFGSYRLDPDSGQLWRGTQVVKLTPKAFAVLRYFVAHPGQLVTKDDLFAVVWPETVVTEATLASCIQALRRALRDKATVPRYLETVHRRGYRFLPAVTTATPVVSSQHSVASSSSSPASSAQHPAPTLVGREPELAQLHKWLDKALDGERQIIFVTGEPGIGKTALVEAFLETVGAALRGRPTPGQPHRVAPTPDLWLAHGQCIEHYGAGEAYLPLLSALGQLGREPGHERLVEVLQQYAPTWLVQLPALVDSAAYEALQRKTQGATRERMLRELAEALEVLTAEHPLVLALEDLHWSDPSTLELLAFIARRSQPARLCILGTYRPVEILTEGHPLQGMTHELFAHELGKELSLSRLSEADVTTYLTLRFPESALPTRLGQVLYQRTGGTPLFLASLVQDLISREVLFQAEDNRWVLQGDVAELETWTPESVRHVLARQRARLTPEDQQVLAAASLAGLEFSAAAVAAALETKVIQVEEHCGRLAEQQQFLRPAGIGEWPDGTRAARYGFLHALYQEFWHERVSVGKQQQWHLKMGERKEAAYGQRASEIAVELALHFTEGRDYRRAVQYLHQAGQNAVRRSANQEAITHFAKGLELLKTLPDTPDRTQQELQLHLALSGPLTAAKGYTHPEVEQVYSRARELCRQVGETPHLFRTLLGLCVFYLARAKHKTAREIAEQGLHLAQDLHNPTLLMWAHYILGNILFWPGEFALAREHWEAGIALYDPQQPRFSVALENPKVGYLAYTSWGLWFLGYPDQALQRSHEALTLAQELSHTFGLAFALNFAADLHRFRREVQAVQERAEALIALSTERGMPPWLASAAILRGWALAEQGQGEEGISQIRQGLAARRGRVELGQPAYLAFLAEAYGKTGQVEEGLTVLDEALAAANKTGERFYEAELWRLKGELTLVQERSRLQAVGLREKTEEAEECFLQAIEIARRQSAKSLELRATVSLARLWQQQGKQHEAHKLLAEIYSWFTEGFDTKDLQEAKALLAEIS